MIFSDTEMMELGIRHTTNIHNTRSLIRTLKYVLDILQTEEAFTVKQYTHTNTHTHNQRMIQGVDFMEKGRWYVNNSYKQRKCN